MITPASKSSGKSITMYWCPAAAHFTLEQSHYQTAAFEQNSVLEQKGK